MTPDEIRTELAADRGEYPEDTDRIGTHYTGCWQNWRHHNCAVRLIRAMAAESRDTLNGKEA